ncbi:hypothetical protein R3P38DRAFT_2766983 [Favolaschia claudopus]|uniref:Uncharacterized protein n=1 Tax=Favolaschia claudopus TaxID=2862362 RepID=A0AAW0CWY8_9AGAR
MPHKSSLLAASHSLLAFESVGKGCRSRHPSTLSSWRRATRTVRRKGDRAVCQLRWRRGLKSAWRWGEAGARDGRSASYKMTVGRRCDISKDRSGQAAADPSRHPRRVGVRPAFEERHDEQRKRMVWPISTTRKVHLELSALTTDRAGMRSSGIVTAMATETRHIRERLAVRKKRSVDEEGRKTEKALHGTPAPRASHTSSIVRCPRHCREQRRRKKLCLRRVKHVGRRDEAPHVCVCVGIGCEQQSKWPRTSRVESRPILPTSRHGLRGRRRSVRMNAKSSLRTKRVEGVGSACILRMLDSGREIVNAPRNAPRHPTLIELKHGFTLLTWEFRARPSSVGVGFKTIDALEDIHSIGTRWLEIARFQRKKAHFSLKIGLDHKSTSSIAFDMNEAAQARLEAQVGVGWVPVLLTFNSHLEETRLAPFSGIKTNS